MAGGGWGKSKKTFTSSYKTMNDEAESLEIDNMACTDSHVSRSSNPTGKSSSVAQACITSYAASKLVLPSERQAIACSTSPPPIPMTLPTPKALQHSQLQPPLLPQHTNSDHHLRYKQQNQEIPFHPLSHQQSPMLVQTLQVKPTLNIVPQAEHSKIPTAVGTLPPPMANTSTRKQTSSGAFNIRVPASLLASISEGAMDHGHTCTSWTSSLLRILGEGARRSLSLFRTAMLALRLLLSIPIGVLLSIAVGSLMLVFLAQVHQGTHSLK